MAFRGFPPEAFEFYERLEADNSKTFWQDNKATYDDAVRAPMAALCDELAEYGPFHLFRPYNDLRFAKNRPPYKTAQGASCETDGGSGYYIHLSAEGLMTAAGCYVMAKDQLQRFREAVDDDTTGTEIAGLVAELGRRGFDVGAHDELKTAPRGYAKDHPRVDLLRRSGLTAWRTWPVAPWMHGKQAVTKVRKAWQTAAPLCAWLDTHVGPTTMAPEAATAR